MVVLLVTLAMVATAAVSPFGTFAVGNGAYQRLQDLSAAIKRASDRHLGAPQAVLKVRERRKKGKGGGKDFSSNFSLSLPLLKVTPTHIRRGTFITILEGDPPLTLPLLLSHPPLYERRTT
jgi:hypothetical protein